MFSGQVILCYINAQITLLSIFEILLIVPEKLLTPGSILKLAIRHCVLGKDTLRLFPIVAEQSTRCGGQADERFAKRTQKKVLCVGVVRHTNEPLLNTT